MRTDLYTPLHQRHVARLRRLPVTVNDEGMLLGATYIMFGAEDELMSRHASGMLDGHAPADVLEIGLGLGVFAGQATRFPLASYTAIEVHPDVAAYTRTAVLRGLGLPTSVHVDAWQTVDLPLSSFDAIMYDTWPPDGLADDDFARFVEHVARPCLRPGGRFSFFSPGRRLSAARARTLDAAFPGWSSTPYTLPAARLPRGWTFPSRDFTVPLATKAVP